MDKFTVLSVHVYDMDPVFISRYHWIQSPLLLIHTGPSRGTSSGFKPIRSFKDEYEGQSRPYRGGVLPKVLEYPTQTWDLHVEVSWDLKEGESLD